MPKYGEDIAEVREALKVLNDRGIRTEDNTNFLTNEMKELKGDVKEIRRAGFAHVSYHPPASNGRFSRNEKWIGGGSIGTIVLTVAWGILRELGVLPPLS